MVLVKIAVSRKYLNLWPSMFIVSIDIPVMNKGPKNPPPLPTPKINFFLFVQALQVKCCSIDKISALVKRFIYNITQISNHDWKKKEVN